MGRQRAARVKVDVRWDPETAETAGRVAAEVGVSRGEVLRRAAAAGMASAAAALRAEVDGVGGAAGVDVGRLSARGLEGATLATSGAAGTMRGAGTASPGGPRAPSPRPASAAPASSGVVRKLEVEVALRASRVRPLQRADVVRARRAVQLGRIAVGGVVCKDPNRLVNPADVAPAG